MRISTKIIENKIRAVLIVMALVVAITINPVAAMAYEYDRYDEYAITEMLEMLRVGGHFMVLFEPAPGAFTEVETRDGMRFVPVGQRLPRSEFPYAPVREGYAFDGWRLYDERVYGDYLDVTDHHTLEAIWVRYDEATTTATPSPTPTSDATATPSPTPSQSAGAPNPQNPTTSPLAISLMIFGAVAALGIAAFSIVSLSMRHTVAVGKYRKNAMRFKRESRLVSMLGIGNSKQSREN